MNIKPFLKYYTVVIGPILEDEVTIGYSAHYSELRLTLSGYGTTPAEALMNLEESALALADVLVDDWIDIPAPDHTTFSHWLEDDEEEYNDILEMWQKDIYALKPSSD